MLIREYRIPCSKLKLIYNYLIIKIKYCSRMLKIYTGMIKLNNGVYKCRKLYKLYYKAHAKT